MSEISRVYRYRLYPTRRQVAALEDQLGFGCDLYNAALEQRITSYRQGRPVRLGDQQKELTKLRREIGPDMNYVAQEMILQRLNLAFEAFFRRLRQGEAPGFPRFKPKQRFNTLTWRRGMGGAAIVNARLRIQGVGHIKVKWHRELPGEVRQTRITRRNGRWYVAFTVRIEKPAPLPATGQEVGVDLGVRRFATLSTAEVVTGPHPLASPVTLEILRDLLVRFEGQGELTTPTGAALIRALSRPGSSPPQGSCRACSSAGEGDQPSSRRCPQGRSLAGQPLRPHRSRGLEDLQHGAGPPRARPRNHRPRLVAVHRVPDVQG